MHRIERELGVVEHEDRARAQVSRTAPSTTIAPRTRVLEADDTTDRDNDLVDFGDRRDSID